MGHSRCSSDIMRGHFYFQNDQKDQADVTFSKLAWFSHVRKIRDDQEFYCFPTIPHFDDKIKKTQIIDIVDTLDNFEELEAFLIPN